MPNPRAEIFQPYGAMPEGDTGVPGTPADWRSATPFDQWLEDNLAMLRENLWPEYNADTGWVGDAQKNMSDLTIADLEIIQGLRASIPKALDTLPKSPLRNLTCPSHRDQYKIEDGAPRFGELHRHYDRDISREQFIDALPAIFSRSRSRKANNEVVFWFKTRLQRPRPYQTSLILGYRSFTHEPATTALHPSMISGHCFVGLMGVAGIFERFFEEKLVLPQEAFEALQQYGVDIGDRRVMAGVHYPSDNLASWLIVLDLCDRVCSDRRVRKQIWKAISQRSLVFSEIEAIIDKPEGKPFGEAWELLHERAR